MKKLMLVAVVALLCAAPANAKELLGAQLCGAGGCATERQAGLFEGQGGGPLGDGMSTPPAQAGPWYRGALLLGDRGKVYGRYAFYYVPDGRLVVQPGMDGQTTTWLKAHGALGGLLERLAAKLRPFPGTEARRRRDQREARDPILSRICGSTRSAARRRRIRPTRVRFRSCSRQPIARRGATATTSSSIPGRICCCGTARSSRSPATSPTGRRTARASPSASGCRGR